VDDRVAAFGDALSRTGLRDVTGDHSAFAVGVTIDTHHLPSERAPALGKRPADETARSGYANSAHVNIGIVMLRESRALPKGLQIRIIYGCL
jgi:hypothetical protein